MTRRLVASSALAAWIAILALPAPARSAVVGFSATIGVQVGALPPVVAMVRETRT